jgi:hypothetical protein
MKSGKLERLEESKEIEMRNKLWKLRKKKLREEEA